tara:strand:- start:348 stop:539 length:192 start_codon:yes stop_codon:yes gene_type:complete
MTHKKIGETVEAAVEGLRHRGLGAQANALQGFFDGMMDDNQEYLSPGYYSSAYIEGKRFREGE